MGLLVSATADASLNASERLRRAIEEVRKALWMDTAWISLKSEGTAHVELLTGDPRFGREGQRITEPSPCRFVIDMNHVVTFDNRVEAERVGVPLHHEDLHTFVSAPLRGQSGVVGAMSFAGFTRRPLPFTDADREFAAILARWVESVLEQRHAVQELQVRDARLAHAVQAAQLGFWETDLVAGTRRMDAQWLARFGLNGVDSIPLQEWFDRIHPDDRGQLGAQYASQLESDAPSYSVEYRVRTGDGRYRWLLQRGSVEQVGPDAIPQRVLGVMVDIDASKRAAEETEARLRRTQRQQEALQHVTMHPSIPNGDLTGAADIICLESQEALDVDRVSIWTYDDRTNRIRCIRGTDRQSTVPYDGLELPLAEYPSFLRALRFSRCIAAVDAATDSRTHEFSRDYLPAHQLVSLLDAPVRVGGQVVGIVCAEQRSRRAWTSDESSFVAALADQVGQVMQARARKDSDAERRALEQQMQQSQKLESLGLLAGGIAHDFNNMLLGILGNADLAAEALADQPRAVPYLRDIETTARRAAEMCRQLLAYSGRGRLEVRPVDINRLVDEITTMLGIAVPKHIEVQYQLAENLPAVEADASQLRQVLMNLVTNACEAIGEHAGSVRISTTRTHVRTPHKNPIGDPLSAGAYVVVRVRDDGSGMDADTASRIFDPFFTTKFTGRGLGLATVVGIIRGHRGSISVDSELGKGTTFTVLLPATEARARHTLPSVAPPAPAADGASILVVDDEPMVRRASSRMLEASGFVVVAVPSGEAAIRALDAQPGRFAGVLLDWAMPGLGGEGTFRAMREREADLPIVIASGYSEQDIVRKLERTGNATFLQKPFRRAELLSSMRSVLHEG